MLWTSLLLFEETLLYADSSVCKVQNRTLLWNSLSDHSQVVYEKSKYIKSCNMATYMIYNYFCAYTVELSNVYIWPTTRANPFKIRKRVWLKPASYKNPGIANHWLWHIYASYCLCSGRQGHRPGWADAQADQRSRLSHMVWTGHLMTWLTFLNTNGWTIEQN